MWLHTCCTTTQTATRCVLRFVYAFSQDRVNCRRCKHWASSTPHSSCTQAYQSTHFEASARTNADLCVNECRTRTHTHHTHVHVTLRCLRRSHKNTLSASKANICRFIHGQTDSHSHHANSFAQSPDGRLRALHQHEPQWLWQRHKSTCFQCSESVCDCAQGGVSDDVHICVSFFMLVFVCS